MPLTMTKVWDGANPVGMVVGKTGSGGRRMIVYRDGAGVFYTDDLVNLTGWVAGTGIPVKTLRAPVKISWPNRGNAQTVALALPTTAADGGGVYISRNRGQTWTLVWSTSIDRWSGFVVGYSGTPVFGVNQAGELRRFTFDGSTWLGETITNIPRAGALAVDDQNRMYVFQNGTATLRNRILRVDDMTQTGTALLFSSLTSSFDLGADTSGEHFIRMNGMVSEADYVFTIPMGGSLVVGDQIDVGGGGGPGETIRRITVADQGAASERAIRTTDGSSDRLVFSTDATFAIETTSLLRPEEPEPPPVIGNTNWFDSREVMPTFKVTVRFDSTNTALNASRVLNTPNSAIAGEVEFGSVMPGGFDAFRCVIANEEYNTPDGLKAYRYGSVVTVRIADTGVSSASGSGAQPNAGSIVYQGMLKSPSPQQNGTVLLEAVGWKILAEERDEDLLYCDEAYDSWQPTDGDPFGGGFTVGDTIEADAGKNGLKLGASKGAQLQQAHVNRIAWYFEGHTPRRWQFTVFRDKGMPDYQLVAEKFVGPTGVGTAVVIKNDFVMTGQLADGDHQDYDLDVSGTQRPIIAFGLRSTVDRSAENTSPRNFLRIRNIRVLELAGSYQFNALQCLRVLNDPSKVADPIDMFIGAASSSGLVSDVTKQNRPLPRFMPLWWQDGTWWELMEHLATAHAFKVALWESHQGDLGSPLLEFRPWIKQGVHTGTLHNVYGWDSARAHANVDLRPSDEVYSRVDVSFSMKGSERIRHERMAVTPNPFAGLPKNRKRVFRYHLEDPQPDRSLPEQIAGILAEELAEEQFSGTVTCSYVYAQGNTEKRNASLVRAGDQLRILDWPFGARNFRVYGVSVTETEVTIQIGRTPIRVDQLVAQGHRKLMATGRISSNPA